LITRLPAEAVNTVTAFTQTKVQPAARRFVQTGMAYDKLVQVTAADGRIMSDTSVMCESAFDNGDMPDCGDDNLDGTLLPTGLRDPLTGDAVVYEPTYRNYLYYPNGTQRPQAEIDQLEAGGVAPCEMSENPAADYCAPWAQTYGFFFGDGENTDIVLTITKVLPPNTPRKHAQDAQAACDGIGLHTDHHVEPSAYQCLRLR
jgi:hypothetical protein